MEDLITEKVTDSSKVTRRWLGLTNNEILFPIIGIAGSAAVMSLHDLLGIPAIFLLPVVPLPIGIALFLLFGFFYKKPPHYASDYIDENLYGDYYSPSENKFSLAPDGMIVDDMIIWGDLGDGYWSAGLDVLVPPMDYARNEDRNNLKLRLDSLLSFFSQENVRVQFFWTIGDHYSELFAYDSETESLPKDHITYKYRKDRFNQYLTWLNEGRLRRERLIIFVSKEIHGNLSGNLSKEALDEAELELLQATRLHAMQHIKRAENHLVRVGCVSRRVKSDELFSLIRQYFNPSFNYIDVKSVFNSQRSIKENCIFSDITKSEEFSLCIDNLFVCVIALQDPLPMHVYQGITWELVKLDIHEYNITVNIIPRDIKKTIVEEEKALNVIKQQLKQENAPETLEFNYIDRKAMLGELNSGRNALLDCQILITVSAISIEEMQKKATAIKGTLANMNIGYYMLSEAKSAINAFYQATPGWLFGKRPKHSFRTLNKYASCLIPFSSTYTGNLQNAEAIYNGSEGNLVGFKQFARSFSEDSDPQHSVIFGKTGSGKSVLTCDLLMQTQGFYEYTCIIDYGLSYMNISAAFGHKPIRLGPSTGITINYFDTNGLPLTGDHQSMVGIILRVMCKDAVSEGLIDRYLEPFYLSQAEKWLQNNEDQIKMLTSIAILQNKYLEERQVEEEGEAYQLALEKWESANFDDETLDRYMFKDAGRKAVLKQCFALFSPKDFPTHSLFVNYIRSKPQPEEEDPKGLQDFADALNLWRSGGKNGRLFDGITNLKLDGDFEYFELSSVPDNDPHFKFVTGAVIQMVAMSKIERLPRHLKKRLIIDEANSFFEIPQGAKVIEAAMTKYRKHRCAVLVSFQQYEMLNNKEISESVISNLQHYILLAQSDHGDVNKIGDALGLSQAIKEAVLQFETPDNLPEHDRYTGFAHVTKKGGLTAGIGRNYLTREMLDMIQNKNNEEV